MLISGMYDLSNEHLNLNNYDLTRLEKNLPNLDMAVILRTQTLDINFIVNYILNDKYQFLESEKDIDINDVLSHQKHINRQELLNKLF